MVRGYVEEAITRLHVGALRAAPSAIWGYSIRARRRLSKRLSISGTGVAIPRSTSPVPKQASSFVEDVIGVTF
jgi:hypothetical protein